MDYKGKLTILLALKDRPVYTWRWMSYAERVGLPLKVFIADGGRGTAIGKILADRSRFPHVDYEYRRYPFDETCAHYFTKLADAFSRITTPYVVQTCNDDFPFVEGLTQAAAFLDDHADFASAGGDMQDFCVDDARLPAPLRRVYGRPVLAERAYPADTFAAATAIERLDTFILHKFHNSYLWAAVQRTENMRRVYRELAAVFPRDLRFADHFIFFSLACLGNMMRIDAPYLLHQANPQQSTGQRSVRRFPTWIDWIARDGWTRDFDRVTAAVAQFVHRIDGMAIDDAASRVRALYLSCVGQAVVDALHPRADAHRAECKQAARQAVVISPEFAAITTFLKSPPDVPESLLAEAAALDAGAQRSGLARRLIGHATRLLRSRVNKSRRPWDSLSRKPQPSPQKTL